MKRSTTFRLSEEARSIIKEKAEEFHLSQVAILEYMVCEHSLSTKAEKLEQKRQHRIAFNNFLNSIHPRIDKHDDIASAWRQGFSEGWKQFQARKASSIFKKEKIKCQALQNPLQK